MKAVILAAGRGSRLGSLTDERPKCMVPLLGRPLLDWQLGALASAGVTDVHVVTGYCSEVIQSHAAYPTLHNPRWRDTNMVGSLLLAAPILRTEPVLVCYADIVYSDRVIRAIASSSAPVAIAYDRHWMSLWNLRFANPLDDAECFRLDGNCVHTIGGRAHAAVEIEGQYMGLLKFHPEGWAQVEAHLSTLRPSEIDRLDMTGMLARLIAEGGQIRAVPVEGQWCEVDNPEDVAVYEARIKLADEMGPGGEWIHDWRSGGAAA